MPPTEPIDLPPDPRPAQCLLHTSRLDEVAVKVGQIWDALRGGELSGHGLIARVDALDVRLAAIESLRTRADGALWATRLIWTGAGGILVFLLHHFAK